MPGRDRKGPQGQGPKTGRGLGNCTDSDRTEHEAPEVDPESISLGEKGKRSGRGMANRRGSGLGRGRGPGSAK